MNENPNTNSPVPTPTELAVPGAVEVVTVNFDELKPNSILVIKINPEGMQQRIAATQQIAKALSPFAEIFKTKHILPMVMTVNETMEVLEEEQMNACGWEKKKDTRIITL